jgi:hypothetical protein
MCMSFERLYVLTHSFVHITNIACQAYCPRQTRGTRTHSDYYTNALLCRVASKKMLHHSASSITPHSADAATLLCIPGLPTPGTHEKSIVTFRNIGVIDGLAAGRLPVHIVQHLIWNSTAGRTQQRLEQTRVAHVRTSARRCQCLHVIPAAAMLCGLSD